MQIELIIDRNSLLSVTKYERRDDGQAEEQPVGIEYLLLPHDKETNSTFPIWIDEYEFLAIASVLEKTVTPRPLTYDLFKNILVGCGISVTKIVITKLEEGIFFADVYCQQDEEEKIIDSRPSSAIALALRFGSPVFIENDLLVQILGDEEVTKAMVYIEENRPSLLPSSLDSAEDEQSG